MQRPVSLSPRRIVVIALLTTAVAMTACTTRNTNFDYPEPPVRRGSF